VNRKTVLRHYRLRRDLIPSHPTDWAAKTASKLSEIKRYEMKAQ
jgi:hypothetical protein